MFAMKNIKAKKYKNLEAKNILVPGNSDIGNNCQIINQELIKIPLSKFNILNNIIKIRLKNNPQTTIKP